MIVWAAVDVLGGRAVRLKQGRREEVTDYGSALQAATRWTSAGLRHLHMVDLSAAFGEAPALPEIVKSVKEACPEAELQVGGGVRSAADAVRLAEAGADRVVVGSLLARSPEEARKITAALGADRTVAAADCKGLAVQVAGWTQDGGLGMEQAVDRARELGFGSVLVTDISRDGLLTGPNLLLCHDAAGRGLPVIASGGVATVGDLSVLATVPGVGGVIVGRALYEGTVSPEELLSWRG